MDAWTFARPEWLWLAALAPLFLWRRRKTGGVRGALIVTARIGVYLLLVAALAQPARRHASDAVTTYFLLDHSGSVPEAQRASSLEIVRNAVRHRSRPQDRAGLIVFGEDAIVEESPTPNFRVDQIYSVVGPSQTDLSAALRLALSTFPDDTQKRIVLFTDGNATKGDLPSAVDRAIAARCPVDVVPLKYRYPDEVLLDSLTLPRKVKRREPFQIRSNVVSLSENTGRLSVLADGQVIAQRDVPLHPGDNVFLFSHALEDPGFHLFEARIESPRDGIAQNNVAQAYTIIEEEPLVLLAAESEEDVRPLADALREAGLSIRVRLADALPKDPGEWQSYDAIVFVGLGAEHVSLAQMEMIESQVRDLGTGFMMIGGPRSFGAGGYLGTPIEKVLPVNLSVNQSQLLPSGGIVFILDHIHCIGDRWSKDICAGSLGGLEPSDSFGLLIPDERWTIPLQAAQDKPAMLAQIEAAIVGDVDGADRYLDRAARALSQSRCATQHIVYVTDGGGGPRGVVPSDAAVDRLRAAKITLSIVLIEPRGSAAATGLRAAAARGGGNFYVVQPHQRERVPQIFIRESSLVKKGLYFEEPFVPVVRENSEILEGIAPGDLPPLLGYDVTSRKDPTEVPLVSPHGDAILAHWRTGLGKTVAFTSDASRRWGARWISWKDYRKFWSQTVRWCQRRTAASPYTLTLQPGRKENTCDALIDAQDEAGHFVNFLSPAGTLVSPDLRSKHLAFEQVGPGRYRAQFPADQPGGYIVNVQYPEGGKSYLLRGGYVPPYQPEYRAFEDNEPLLLSMADRTGGRRIEPGMDLFERTGEVPYTSEPVWPLLLLAAVCLLPFDIAARRVVIGWADLARGLARLVARRRVKDPVELALAGTREEIRQRFSWTPSGPETPLVEAEKSAGAPAVAPEAPLEANLPERLMEAKKRAKKEFDKK